MKSQGASKNEANNAAQAVKAELKSVEKIDFSNVKIEPLFEEMVDFDTFSKSDFRAVKVLECEAVGFWNIRREVGNDFPSFCIKSNKTDLNLCRLSAPLGKIEI